MFYGIVFNHESFLPCRMFRNLLKTNKYSLGEKRKNCMLKLVNTPEGAYYLPFSSKIDKENSVPSKTP